MPGRVAKPMVIMAVLIVGLAALNLVQLLWPSPARERSDTAELAQGAPRPAASADTGMPKAGGELSDDEIVRRFHAISYRQQFGYWFEPVEGGLPHVQGKGHGTPSKWLGIVTAQNPFDAWIQQEIITEVKPDLIVETGTYFGGSAILWAMVQQQVNPAGRVVTIDIEDRLDPARKVPIFREKVDFLLGSSTDPKIVDQVKARAAGKKVLVILDSVHTKAHVASEIAAYAPLVSVDSYLIVQDTNFNRHPAVGLKQLDDFGPGPYEAAEDFLLADDRFVADRTRERFLFTINPRGYLKRVK